MGQTSYVLPVLLNNLGHLSIFSLSVAKLFRGGGIIVFFFIIIIFYLFIYFSCGALRRSYVNFLWFVHSKSLVPVIYRMHGRDFYRSNSTSN